MPRSRLNRFLCVFPEPTENLVQLWLLRVLIPMGCHNNLIMPHGFYNDSIAAALGLCDGDFDTDGRFDRRSALKKIRSLYIRAERQRTSWVVPLALAQNCEKLKNLMGLSEIDCRILEFAVLLQSDDRLTEVTDYLGGMSLTKVCRAIPVLLDLPEAEVQKSLATTGVLSNTGLVNFTKRYGGFLKQVLDLPSDSFADQMLANDDGSVGLLKGTVVPSRPPELRFDDFKHASDSLSILRPYLRRAVETRRTGVNVFVHGKPGTGKTQLARLLAQDLGCELFEVASESKEGDPTQGERRLRAFKVAQSFFSDRRALILFDETEDIFNDGNPIAGGMSTAQTRKAWMNRMLEDNSVPTIWLSNSVSCMDAAFIRRFDLVMELQIPPKRQREQIVAAACGDLLKADALSRIASADHLAPAVITRAASVVQTIKNDLSAHELSRAIEHLVGNTLVAQGHPALPKSGNCALPTFYNPHLLNTDVDMVAVAEGISTSRSARICLYGPPGTGKSAFGRWLADHLGVPLNIRKVSDIVSPLVGVTEKKIARAFTDAEADGAVLLIDEVDSFLRDRRGAQRSWEVTEVNEMLTQMESFNGVFIASTNLMDGLDQAALRRFDLKVSFGYLRPEQAWQLLLHQCELLGLDAPPPRLRTQLDRIPSLTPGDYAAVTRLHRFKAITSAQNLLDALTAECAVKEDGRKSAIGFA